jgi:hypothetical protein
MADKVKLVQGQDFQLSGGGIGLTDTSITIDDFVLPNSGTPITMDMFGVIGYITLEPETNREENISFTDVIDNGDTTSTITGVVRGLPLATTADPADYNTPDLNLRQPHSGGSLLRITNSVSLLQWFASKANEETIEEKWTFPSEAGVNRPVIGADTQAVLATELVTLGDVSRIVQATFLPPVVVSTSQGSTNLVQGQITPFAHVVPVGLTSGGTFAVVHTQEDVTVSSITLGAQNFTQVATETRAGSNQRIEIWRLLAPTAGSNNITVTTSGNAYSTAQVITLENVNQATPVDALSTGADGSGTAVADAITTITANSVILMGVGGDTDPTVFTPTAPLAEQLVDDAGTLRPTSTSVRSTTTAGVYNLAYTISPSQDYVTKAIAIRGVAGGGGSDAFTVGATSADTTPDFLDDKIEIVSADSSVTIVKTIQNPGANEKISYDLSAIGGSGSGGTKLAIDTTQVTVSGTVTETALATIAIPAGTLGTNDAIRFSLICNNTFSLDNSETLTLRMKYGGSTISTVVYSNTSVGVTAYQPKIEGFIVANNASNAQKGLLSFIAGEGDIDDGSNKAVNNNYGTSSVDSTVSQNLIITAQFSSTGTPSNEIYKEAIIVEKITDGSEVSQKKVGVGEVGDVEWFNAQIPFDAEIWSVPANRYTNILFTASDTAYTNNADGGVFPALDGGSGSLQFNDGKQVIIQMSGYINSGNVGAFGLNGHSDTNGITTSNNILCAAFVSDGTDLFAQTATGAARTSQNLGAVVSSLQTWRIEFDPGNATPQVRFYVDGVLVATNTTNLPSSATEIGITYQNDTGDVFIETATCPSFAVEI